MASLAELKERAKARTAANKATQNQATATPTTVAAAARPSPRAAAPAQQEIQKSERRAEAPQAKQRVDLPHPSGDPRFKLVDRTLQRFQYQQDALIEVLHTAQEAFGFLEDDLLLYVARQLRLPPSWVYGVATFYHFFSLKPTGEHNCVVCLGTACYVKRAAEVLATIEATYQVKSGETTTDNKLSLSTARCLGSCGLAPVLVLDGNVIGRGTPAELLVRMQEALRQVASTTAPTGP
ncbi:MAG: bidirectional hydrogenase complex protein HoxE [Caldilineaceae bacterium]|nr:bidirectional hydrogenase complex protein HoxE [Caldilineaceae bacterium]